jgi:hypothetical protein
VPERVTKWLTAENISYSQLIGEDARNTLFSCVLTLGSGTTIRVIQASARIDSICVSAVLGLTPVQVKMLSQKTKTTSENVFNELRFKLACIDVELDVHSDNFVVSNTIYYDGLTKDRFFKAVSDVDKAYGFAGWLLEQML